MGDVLYPLQGRDLRGASLERAVAMETPDITIRIAGTADAELLAELGARTFRDAFAADNTASDMAAYLSGAFSLDIQRSELDAPGSVFLIAEVDESAAGYARLVYGDAPECVPGERKVEVRRLYSDAQWIGAGVGSALMTACLKEAVEHGCDVAWLDVWSRNPRAIAFYSKMGFEVVGEQTFVLGDDVQDDLLMARRTG